MARPLPLAAIAVLLVNDHVLKRAAPGLVSGKLSDVAGLVFFPILLHALADLAAPPRDAIATESRRALAASLATALVFALVKTWEPAAEAYRVGLGVLQWPLRGSWSLALGHAWPRLARASLVRDATDLVALPFAFASAALAAVRARSAADPAHDVVAAPQSEVAAAASPEAAAARGVASTPTPGGSTGTRLDST